MEKSQHQNQNHPKKPKQKMQKPQQQNPPQSPRTNHKIKRTQQSQNHVVWDCESALYDSFELNSFQNQLNSAIHARTMSMPREIRGIPFPNFPEAVTDTVSKKSGKIGRFSNFRRIFKSVFRLKQNYVVYGESGAALKTIPEDPEVEFARFSPEINRFVRKTVSERFSVPASSIGISCA